MLIYSGMGMPWQPNGNPARRIPSRGAEQATLVDALSRNGRAAISELKVGKAATIETNITKAGMSVDKRAGFQAEHYTSATFNESAKAAGDFKTRAILTKGNDPRVDLEVVSNGKTIAEAQVKSCKTPIRSAASASKERYAGAQVVVPKGHAREGKAILDNAIKRRAGSTNPKIQAKTAVRAETSKNLTENLSAKGHKSRPLSNQDAQKLAHGDTGVYDKLITRRTVGTAAKSGAISGAAISGGITAATELVKVARGRTTSGEAAKTVATEVGKGAARGAATAVLAEGTKAACKRVGLSAVTKGSAPMAVAGALLEVGMDVAKGEASIKKTVQAASRAAGGWGGAELGMAIGLAGGPPGVLLGGLIGGTLGSLFAGALTS